MQQYDNIKPQKRSPFADSPYECAFPQPAPVPVAQPKPVSQPATAAPQPAQEVQRAPKQTKTGKRIALIALVCFLMLATCTATAILVSVLWESRYENMELAMQEKVDALEQVFNEKTQQNNANTSLPSQGPLTPSQVYEKNVNAVVAVNALYEMDGQQGESAGSGFVISADGYVVTNYHVIEGAVQIAITTPKGESYKATVVGVEETNDVALLKVEATDLDYVTLGSSDALVVGEMVMAIGNPLGELTSTLTVGYVSAKDRIVDTEGSVINMLQTDVAINSGNSGGPLFNTEGEVVGIITAKYSGDSGSGTTIEGLGFAIPLDDVKGILSDLKEFGYVTGAYLGVSVQDVDASAQYYGLPAGAYVVETVSGGPADKGGIRSGDIIVNLGGYDVDSINSLTRILRRFEAGQSVSVTVYRNGQQVYLTLVLGEKPVQNEDSSSNNNTQTPNTFEDWFGGLFPGFGG